MSDGALTTHGISACGRSVECEARQRRLEDRGPAIPYGQPGAWGVKGGARYLDDDSDARNVRVTAFKAEIEDMPTTVDPKRSRGEISFDWLSVLGQRQMAVDGEPAQYESIGGADGAVCR